MMFPAVIDTFGDGWIHALTPIQSSNFRPEMRS
jgi:hypothetical protein